MAAEYVRIGRVTRCREVNRYVNDQGITVEVWGDFLPSDACISRVAGGRIVTPRLSVIQDINAPTQTPAECTACSGISAGEKLLVNTETLAVAAGIALLLWLVFKK